MSPRAAARLATIGYDCYDYSGGKTDWLGAGLPREGDSAAELMVGDVARQGLPTASLGERAGVILGRLGDWPQAVVVDGDGVILGRVRRSSLSGSPERPVEDLMEEGPSTVRGDEDLAKTVAGMGEVRYLLVTTPQGHLIGLLYRDDARRSDPGTVAPNPTAN